MLSKAGQPPRGPSPAVVQAPSLLLARQIGKDAEGLPRIGTPLKESALSEGTERCLSFWRWAVSLAIGFI